MAVVSSFSLLTGNKWQHWLKTLNFTLQISGLLNPLCDSTLILTAKAHYGRCESASHVNTWFHINTEV